MMTCKSPFLLSLETKQNDTKKIDFLGGDSDHLTLLNMYDQWMLARQRDSGTQKAFLRENHLSRIVLDMITATRRQLLDYLIDSKFVKAREQNDASKVYDTYLLKAVLVAALYPNIIQSIPDNPERPKKYQLTSMTGEQIKIHPCSVFKNTTKFWPPFILYLEKIKTNDIFIRDVTLVDPIQLVLFGGEVLIDGKKILMESSWIRISCSNAQLLLFLKMELDNLIMQKLKNPIVNLNKNRFFKAIKNIISSNGQKA
jgi:HrpA-like RNA helicase